MVSLRILFRLEKAGTAVVGISVEDLEQGMRISIPEALAEHEMCSCCGSHGFPIAGFRLPWGFQWVLVL